MTEGTNTETQQTYKQHPIPQHVLGVEFKLIGGLTIRQFGLLAAFAVVAFIVYSSDLPGLIKTPLAVLLALGGAFISLVPIQDRPANVWLKNFLVAISQPTERVWRKTPANLDVFFEMRQAHTIIKEEKNFGGPARPREEVSQYLRTALKEEASPLDLAESEFLKSVDLLQTDVTLPAGFQVPPQPPTTAAQEAAAQNEGWQSRQEVRVSPTLASEVNFSQEKVISLPTAGRRTKFIAPIQNVKAGRRLKITSPLEAGAAILGEKKVSAAKNLAASTPPPQPRSPEIKGTIIIEGPPIPQPETKPAPLPLPSTRPAEALGPTKELVNRVWEVNQKIETAIGTQNRKQEVKDQEKRPVPEEQLKSEAQATPAGPAGEKSSPEVGAKASEVAGRLVALGEELVRLRAEKENLKEEVEKQKKARLEAETFATLASEYQKQIGVLNSQNEQLARESKKALEDLRQLQNAVTTTASERENLLRQAKESQKRIDELAREKTQATDNLLNLQRELRELRLRQRFAPPSPGAGPGRPPSSPPSHLAQAKAVPFVKDRANIINGYVKDNQGNLLKEAILIIKDEQGEPVRALKTNEVGQFAITTPVGNGVYSLEASFPGKAFDIMSVEVFGTVLDPVEIVAKT